MNVFSHLFTLETNLLNALQRVAMTPGVQLLLTAKTRRHIGTTVEDLVQIVKPKADMVPAYFHLALGVRYTIFVSKNPMTLTSRGARMRQTGPQL